MPSDQGAGMLGVAGPTGALAPAAQSAWSRLGAMARDIKLAHSVFALPFALLGAFLARKSAWPGVWGFVGQLAIIVVCMVAARTWAMLVNRLVDRHIDAANPRTAKRAFASGRVSAASGWVVAFAAAVAFVGATSLFWAFFGNRWPALLSLPVLAWIALYSLTKRFTALCHVVLGVALAASPVAAAIAVNPSSVIEPLWPPSVPSVWMLALMVAAWVAGFDIIYALQDIEVDRREGLRSIPARLGARGAILVSRGLHAMALLFLVGAWLSDGTLGPIFGGAVVLAGALLVMEHVVLARRGEAGLDMAFFTLNGIVSCVVGAAGCVDAAIN
ncbi:MAG: 4-hydroxybenzoate octaprenyltransferase [Phycisphaerales bacterium]